MKRYIGKMQKLLGLLVGALFMVVGFGFLLLGISWLPIIGIIIGTAFMYAGCLAWSGALFSRSVEIDVVTRPGGSMRYVNLGTDLVIPVAILSRSKSESDPFGFDATRVDAESVRFGPKGVKPIHDMNDPYAVASHQRDADGDGNLDFIFDFPANKAGIKPSSGDVCIRGMTVDGELIQGCTRLNLEA